MEMTEAINIAVAALENEDDPKCDKKDEDKGWTSRVNRHNSKSPATGTKLYENMHNEGSKAHEKQGLGVVPEKKGKGWKLADLDPKNFPLQAHHLIPKSYLPDHQVCTWLALPYKEHDKYELRYDSNYDSDHTNNGYCMPYATPLKEWGGNQTKKTATVFSVMDQVKIQLHQGSHAKVLDAKKLEQLAGKPITPDISDVSGGGDSDDDEQDEIETPGYLDRVELLLNVVDAKSFTHAEKCKPCKKKKSGEKYLVLPTEGVVKLMDRVSAIMKKLIDANVAHVSGYAYFYAYHKGDLWVQDDELWIRGSKKEIKASVNS